MGSAGALHGGGKAFKAFTGKFDPGANNPVPGPNNALRDPASGKLVTNPSSAASQRTQSSSVHGNSRESDVLTWLYRRVAADGTFQKWGITGDLRGRYSRSELGTDLLTPMTYGSRDQMLNLERWLVQNGPGPMNREAWRGTGS